ncbi:oxidoreductase-like protein [Eremomyces bilateralis CBS 781.70]|uniref:Oxidoreductase-like protein n=1 Tax=Eremomyces bilateralis CBS 781.70 TaxID=1392243 RepID=A0A6G1GAS1_9PEZI|nr:oxidoreductase-like protein [Eremomyces bilateralis CBS 781.70]KAF1815102.1 oxidoreductase-like protein [Eremomyces bilateralis CBS 781.70]
MAAPGTTAAVEKDDLVIPLIDFAPFLSNDQELKTSVASSVLKGFQSAGFLYLTNHGIPQSLVDKAFSRSARFFTRPQSEKDLLEWYAAEANRGYTAHGREKVTRLVDKDEVAKLRASVPDIKESFEIGRDDEPHFPNMWPKDAEGETFRAEMMAFHETCKQLHQQVMRAVAIGMGMEETWFDEYTSAGDNTLRLLHYPSVDGKVFKEKVGTVRAGSHSDYGSVTLLFQDARGGLQVQSPNGTFIDATPVPGSIVVNAGDLLERWANDTIKSTKHRVIEPPSEPNEDGKYPARYSIAYFCNPNFDKFIDAIPGTYEQTGKKYPGVNSGDYLIRRLAATY